MLQPRGKNKRQYKQVSPCCMIPCIIKARYNDLGQPPENCKLYGAAYILISRVRAQDEAGNKQQGRRYIPGRAGYYIFIYLDIIQRYTKGKGDHIPVMYKIQHAHYEHEYTIISIMCERQESKNKQGTVKLYRDRPHAGNKRVIAIKHGLINQALA